MVPVFFGISNKRVGALCKSLSTLEADTKMKDADLLQYKNSIVDLKNEILELKKNDSKQEELKKLKKLQDNSDRLEKKISKISEERKKEAKQAQEVYDSLVKKNETEKRNSAYNLKVSLSEVKRSMGEDFVRIEHFFSRCNLDGTEKDN